MTVRFQVETPFAFLGRGQISSVNCENGKKKIVQMVKREPGAHATFQRKAKSEGAKRNFGAFFKSDVVTPV